MWHSICLAVLYLGGGRSRRTATQCRTPTRPRPRIELRTTTVGGRLPCCLNCYKDYLGLGNRSVYYPYSSVSNTFTINTLPSLCLPISTNCTRAVNYMPLWPIPSFLTCQRLSTRTSPQKYCSTICYTWYLVSSLHPSVPYPYTNPWALHKHVWRDTNPLKSWFTYLPGTVYQAHDIGILFY